jgi:hypothetical protein
MKTECSFFTGFYRFSRGETPRTGFGGGLEYVQAFRVKLPRHITKFGSSLTKAFHITELTAAVLKPMFETPEYLRTD